MGKVSCRFDPTKVFGPIGMFHCPDCGVMLLAGYPHFDDEDCKFQLSEWEAPTYDSTE